MSLELLRVCCAAKLAQLDRPTVHLEFIEVPLSLQLFNLDSNIEALKMLNRLLLVVAVLLVGAQASGTCSQRTLTSEMLPGPDRWHELPDAAYEVSYIAVYPELFQVVWQRTNSWRTLLRMLCM